MSSSHTTRTSSAYAAWSTAFAHTPSQNDGGADGSYCDELSPHRARGRCAERSPRGRKSATEGSCGEDQVADPAPGRGRCQPPACGLPGPDGREPDRAPEPGSCASAVRARWLP